MEERKRAPLSEALLAASQVWQAIKEGASIDSALQKAFAEMPKSLQPAVQSLVYQVARKRALVNYLINKLALKKPSAEVEAYLEVALAIAVDGTEKPFVLVNEAVNGAKRNRKLANAAGFINAALRRFMKEKDRLLKEALQNPTIRFNAPKWWIEKYKKVFPASTQELEVQQKHPPLTLRVNPRKTSREEYLKKLNEAGIKATPIGLAGVVLSEAISAKEIPGLIEGEVSVQDAGSQLAAQILSAENGMEVLDACAAPGGKTGHLLELSDIKVTAVEKDPERAKKIVENLARLGEKATIVIADANETASWANGKKFDRILLDAPCSASGVVRRHPDIPWLKRQEDINSLARQQKKLLEKTWPLLAKGGRILYSVCSVMPEEGVDQIRSFLQERSDAKLVPFEGAPQGQLLLAPQEKQPAEGFLPWVNDGFFYALIEKI